MLAWLGGGMSSWKRFKGDKFYTDKGHCKNTDKNIMSVYDVSRFN